MRFRKIAVVASRTPQAQEALAALAAGLSLADPAAADVIVVIGGDGFMLECLHAHVNRGVPIYGMNQGSVGFLMNQFTLDDLPRRLEAASATRLHPLRMTARTVRDGQPEAIAFNEVSLLRETRQAAKIRILIDGIERLTELICDGVLVSTPAGSSAYNLSAHGPIIPLGSGILALTPISAFRPRRWRGALLPISARVTFEILEPDKRPVSAVADFTEVRDVLSVEVVEDRTRAVEVLYDPEHNLEDRILSEQFTA